MTISPGRRMRRAEDVMRKSREQAAGEQAEMRAREAPRETDVISLVDLGCVIVIGM